MIPLAKMSQRFVLPLLLVCGCFCSQSSAAFSYIFNGRGSGSLGTNLFTDALFTITAQGDETQVFRVENTDVFRLDGVSALLEIDGLGSATFSFVPNLAVNQATGGTNPSVGIADPIQNRAIFFVGNVPSLVNYELKSIFPTVTGRALTNADNAFPTNRGAFIITSATEASFTAVPEPTTSTLLALALVASFNVRRRRLII